jgi:hypothetical protein
MRGESNVTRRNTMETIVPVNNTSPTRSQIIPRNPSASSTADAVQARFYQLQSSLTNALTNVMSAHKAQVTTLENHCRQEGEDNKEEALRQLAQSSPRMRPCAKVVIAAIAATVIVAFANVSSKYFL